MYYPEQRHILAWTTIRRERMLPDNAIGVVEARNGQHVNLRDIVARGTVPAKFHFIEAAKLLKVKPDALEEITLVDVGQEVEAGQVLAAKNPMRGRRALSPVTGIVMHNKNGRIIVQETPELIELEAGLVGQVVATRPGQGIVIEAFGGLIQGVWGNNRRFIGPLQIEPADGLEAIYEDSNSIERQFTGAIVVTKRALKESSLFALEGQNIGGVIAPSMDASLYEHAKRLDTAILLTEGFGDIRMSSYLSTLLEGFVGRQTTLDAFTPDRWNPRRPEVFINLPPRSGERPPDPNTAMTLRTGMRVRLTREPHIGSIAEIRHLYKGPITLENGLRVNGAEVELVTGEVLSVPLANLEVFGR